MKLIHIKQAHPSLSESYDSDITFRKSIIRSQFEVARELKKYTNVPVLVEGLCEDLIEVNPDDRFYSKHIFPKGIPEDYCKLTESQKIYLYHFDAAIILFNLGVISKIFKSIHNEIGKKLNEEVNKDGFRKVHAIREEEAIICVKEAAITAFGKLDNAVVIIIYGANHNLKKYCDENAWEYESIDTTHSFRLTLKNVYCSPVSTLFFTSSNLENLNKQLSTCPDDVSSRLERAKILMSQEKFMQAIQDYESILQRFPTNKEAIINKEICQTILDNASEDKKYFNKIYKEITATNSDKREWQEFRAALKR